MTAEHRFIVTNPVDIKVQILYHGRRFFAARGRSLSTQGMYLDVRNITLPVGTEVELEMECLGKEWRLAAAVVHRSPAGVGVKFREVQPALDRGLAQEPGAGLTPTQSLMPPPQALGRILSTTGGASARSRDRHGGSLVNPS